MDFDPFRAPLLVAGIVTFGIGFASALGPSPLRLRRWFPPVLMLKGAGLITGAFISGTSPQVAGWMIRAQPYLLLPLAPIALYLAVALRQKTGSRSTTWWSVGLVGILVLTVGAYAIDPSSVYTVERGESGQGLETAGSGWVYTAYGPLVVLMALPALAMSLLGLRFAWEANRPALPYRNVYRWYATALIVNGVFDGGMAIAYLIHDPAIGAVDGFGWILSAARALALLPAGAALGILVGHELTKPLPNRMHLLVPSGIALVAWFSGPMPVIFGAADYGATWPTAVTNGIWRATVALLVGFGLWLARAETNTSATSPARSKNAIPGES